MMEKISFKEVLKKHKTYFIADIAANHDGSLKRAKKLIKLVQRLEQMQQNFNILKQKQ